MAVSRRTDLFLQVGGSTSQLQIAMKAGRSTMVETGTTAIDTAAVIQKAFDTLGGGSIEQSTRSIDAAFQRTFAKIQENARKVIAAPTPTAALQIVDYAAAQQAADAATANAASLRLTADAADSASNKLGGTNAAQKVLAVATRAAAIAAEEQAVGLRAQAETLALVHAELETMGRAATEATAQMEALAAAEQAAAEAAANAAREQAVLAARSEQLFRSIDPAYAAQMRYSEALAEANQLQAAGVLTGERYTAVVAAAELALRKVTDAQNLAMESQRELYLAQAASAKGEVDSARLQENIAFTRELALANKEAAASFMVFRQAGLEEAQGSMEVAAGHNKVGVSGLIADHVIRSFADSVAAGQSPVRAFAMELPRVAEAMQFMAMASGETTGIVGKFAGFMGGPWGIALTAGAALLSPLIGKLFEAGDATEAAKKAAQEYATYQNDMANFIDTTNGKLREQSRLLAAVTAQQNRPKIDAQEAAAKTASKTAFDTVRGRADPNAFGNVLVQPAGAGLAPASVGDPQLGKIVSDAAGDIAKLRAGLNAAVAGGRKDLKPLAAQVNDLAGTYAFAKQNAEDLRGKTDELNAALANQGILTQKVIERRVADRTATTPLEKAQAHLRDVQAEPDDITKMPYGPGEQAAWKKYEQDLLAATEAVRKLQAAKRDASDNRQTGRQINLSQAEDIVHGFGGTVTSGYRSTAQQQVLYDRYKAGTGPLAAKPGTSEHESGQAVDIAKAAGITLATIRKAFEAQGVRPTELLDEGNHYHVAWGRKGPSEETMARRQQSAVNKGANDDSAYAGDLRGAQDRYAKAQLGLSETADQRYVIQLDQVRADLIAQDQQAQDAVTAKKMSEAQALQLMVINGMTATLQIEAANRKRISDNVQDQMDATAGATAAQVDLLNLQGQLAVTRTSQYALAKEALDRQQASTRLQIEWKLDPTNANVSQKDRGDALDQYQTLDQTQRLQQQQLQKQYADPVQQYQDGLTKNVGNMNDALKGVQADGLKGLEDGLTGIIDGTETVSGAFKKMATSIIADIARIAVEKGILSLFGGNLLGGLLPGHAAGMVPGHADGLIPGFATGAGASVLDGMIKGPGTGKSDSILAYLSGKGLIRVANGESIVTADATRRYGPMIKAMNDNRLPGFAAGLVPDSSIYMRQPPSAASVQRTAASNDKGLAVHVTPSPYFDVQVTRIAGPLAQAAMVGGIQGSQREMAENEYQRIPN